MHCEQRGDRNAASWSTCPAAAPDGTQKESLWLPTAEGWGILLIAVQPIPLQKEATSSNVAKLMSVIAVGQEAALLLEEVAEGDKIGSGSAFGGDSDFVSDDGVSAGPAGSTLSRHTSGDLTESVTSCDSSDSEMSSNV